MVRILKGALKRTSRFLFVLSLASLLALTPTQGQVNTQTVSFEVPPRYDYYFWLDLSSGNTITFTFYVSSSRGADDISFTLVSSARNILLDAGRVSQYTANYTAVFRGRYYLRFDNSYSVFTTKAVSLSYSVVPPTLRIETYQWGANTVNGSLRNYGTSPIDTENALVSLNDTAIGGLGGSCGQTPLNPGSSCAFSITVPNGTWLSGKPYVVELATSTGSFSFPFVAGGNSESVIETEATLITFQTVNTETTPAVQSENQAIFSQDFFVKNAFSMIGVLAGGVLLISAILGLSAISVASRNRGKGLYGEDQTKVGGSRGKIPLLVTIAAGALSLVIVSVLTPRLTINFTMLATRLPYLLVAGLVLILITSTVLSVWVVTAILRRQRKSLRKIKAEEEVETVLQQPPQTDEIPIPPQQIKKKCHHCGAEVRPTDSICGKCGMPAMYRK